ncbi:MAG: SRPBCC family protein [Corynebacteriales bacterium]|nr:SRPBCC family protein [Mycobacteriales bacterium]
MRRLSGIAALALLSAGLVGFVNYPAQAAEQDSGLCHAGSHQSEAVLRDYREFTQDVVIPGAEVNEVTEFLGDFTRLSEIHPLIVNVTKNKETVDSDGGIVSHYTITDKMDVLGLPVYLTYTSEVRRCGTGELGTHAYQMPGISLWNYFTITPVVGGIRVTEQVDVAAPYTLMGTTYDQGKAAHRTMLDNLKAKFEK